LPPAGSTISVVMHLPFTCFVLKFLEFLAPSLSQDELV